MPKYLKTFVLILLIVSNSKSFGQIRDITKISGCFSDFTKSIENKNGSGALEYVDDSTVIYFSSLLPFVKNFSEASTNNIYIQNSAIIKWIHYNLTSDEIANLKENEFLRFIISNGLFSKLNLQRFHPGEISLHDDKAKAHLTTFSTSEETDCLFVKEDKKWKIKLQSITEYLVNNH